MTTKLQATIARQAEAQRQEAWEDRKRGVEKRRRSLWVVTTMAPYLPPEHVQLALHLCALRAKAYGQMRDLGRVDQCGNGTETKTVAAMDALRELYGYEQAALHRIGSDGRKCFLAIVDSEHLSATAELCGLHHSSHRAVRKLVQLTLLRLYEYREENQRQANPPMRRGEVRAAMI